MKTWTKNVQRVWEVNDAWHKRVDQALGGSYFPRNLLYLCLDLVVLVVSPFIAVGMCLRRY